MIIGIEEEWAAFAFSITEVEAAVYLWDVGKHLPYYLATYLRRQ
jgi:hypothetical protein